MMKSQRGFSLIEVLVSVLVVTTGLARHTPGLKWVSGGIALPAVVLLLLQAWFERPGCFPGRQRSRPCFGSTPLAACLPT